MLPTFVAPESAQTGAVPEPNEAYPTAQASESSASQSVSGFALSLRKAWRDGKQVNAEVCFSLPDSSDWTIWAAHYEYGGTVVSEFSSAFLSKSEAQGGQPAERCDQISFYVPPDADLSASSLTVESVGAYPAADEYCSLYMPKIQQTLNDRGIAITLDCPEVDGVASLQIVEQAGGNVSGGSRTTGLQRRVLHRARSVELSGHIQPVTQGWMYNSGMCARSAYRDYYGTTA